jgi:nitrogen fixation/metabolism regulation signal transduction histidine kinase
MGLAIVRKIVDHHDGQLECMSYQNATGTIMEMRFQQEIPKHI